MAFAALGVPPALARGRARSVARSSSPGRGLPRPRPPSATSAPERSATSPPAPSLSRRDALALALLGAFAAPASAPPAASAASSDAAGLARLARLEPDPEVAVAIWDDVLDLASAAAAAAAPPDPDALASWIAARADCLAALRRWPDAERAYADAASAWSARVEATSPAPAAARDAVALQLALALDNRAFALGALGDWPGALDSSRRALAALGAAGPTAKIADVPTTSPASGLRGGAPTVAQRLAFRAALARWGAGDVAGAANALDRLDLGPEPDPGFPQFWEARAALAAAMWASGAKPRAEAEWARLCEATRPNPPATPTDGVRAAVNRAAQMQFDGYGALMDKRCEDFATGTPLPCDDAGIPGAGGSSAPCRLFTVEEVESRGWPGVAAEALAAFLEDGPEYVLRASEMERG